MRADFPCVGLVAEGIGRAKANPRKRDVRCKQTFVSGPRCLLLLLNVLVVVVRCHCHVLLRCVPWLGRDIVGKGRQLLHDVLLLLGRRRHILLRRVVWLERDLVGTQPLSHRCLHLVLQSRVDVCGVALVRASGKSDEAAVRRLGIAGTAEPVVHHEPRAVRSEPFVGHALAQGRRDGSHPCGVSRGVVKRQRVVEILDAERGLLVVSAPAHDRPEVAVLIDAQIEDPLGARRHMKTLVVRAELGHGRVRIRHAWPDDCRAQSWLDADTEIGEACAAPLAWCAQVQQHAPKPAPLWHVR